ncbi:MAG TPA: hypothetical protein VFN10_00455 [Thermoanaerobaculia bacterium]|nr:hypothetical protein [Thermoanaerobaculia bacterium]
MPEPTDDSESHVERKVVYETVSSSSSRASGITIGVIVVVALILTIWIITHLR